MIESPLTKLAKHLEGINPDRHIDPVDVEKILVRQYRKHRFNLETFVPDEYDEDFTRWFRMYLKSNRP